MRWAYAVASTALVAAAPVAAWGLLGQQDAAGLAPSELDYFVKPFDLPHGLELVLGLVALGLVLASGAVLLSAPRAAFDQRWWGVVVPLAVAGAVVGFGERVLTAGVIGANIGAGLVILLGGPAVGGLVLVAVVQAGVRMRSPDSRGR